MTAANHGFWGQPRTVLSSPARTKNLQIVTGQEDWDIALMQLDLAISYTNTRYFEAPSAQQLRKITEFLFGDWFEGDGLSTGIIDLCARIITQ